MISLREVQRVFNEIANEFDKTRRKPWRCSLEVIGALQKGLLLDIGCGNGRHSILACAMGLEVISIDIAPRMADIALKNLRKYSLDELANPIVADMRYLPLRSACIDGVLCMAVIHHIPTKVGRCLALREIYRTLKDEGLAVITAWSIWNLRRLISAIKMKFRMPRTTSFGDALIPWRRKFLRYYHLYTLRGLVKLIRNSGFKIVKYYSEKGRIFKENLVVVAKKHGTG